MPRMTDTVDEFLEGTSSIEEAENCDTNENVISSQPEAVVDNKTDEEISKVEIETSNMLNPLKEINHQNTGLKLLNKDDCTDCDILPVEESERLEICDPVMIVTNIDDMDIYNVLVETELKSTSNELEQDCINYEKGLVESKTDEEISKMESEISNLFNPSSELNHQNTELKFLNKGDCTDCDILPVEEFERLEICDPVMIATNIDDMDIYNVLVETELKSTSDELPQDCINCEKTIQTVKESAEMVSQPKNQSTKHRNVVPLQLTTKMKNLTLEIPCYINIPNITEEVSKPSHLNIPICEESDETVNVVTKVIEDKAFLQKKSDNSRCASGSFNNNTEQPRAIIQPSKKAALGETSQDSEDTLNQTDESVKEFYSKQVASSNLSKVLEASSNPLAESLEKESQTPSIGDGSSTVSEIMDYVTNASKTAIEQSKVSKISEDSSQIEISRNLDGRRNLKKAQLIEVLKFLDNMISLVDNLELMNNYLTTTAQSLIEGQRRIQDLINIVHEYLVKLQFLPSTVIFIDNGYTDGVVKFNVQKFGEGIFEKLKSMKKELNVTFREYNAFRKDFRYVSRQLCLVRFESTPDHEMQNTLEQTIGLYFKVRLFFDKRQPLELIENRISSETLSMVSCMKEFGDYLNILNESQCSEL